jgi:hypothetical protein
LIKYDDLENYFILYLFLPSDWSDWIIEMANLTSIQAFKIVDDYFFFTQNTTILVPCRSLSDTIISISIYTYTYRRVKYPRASGGGES